MKGQFWRLLLLLAAVAGATRGWELGSGSKYRLMTTLLFSEAKPSKSSGDVGFRLTGELDVTAVWQDPQDPDGILLKIQLVSPKLWIKSRRAPEPEGFVEHSSKVDRAAKKALLVLWRKGEVASIYADNSESVSSLNLKRGLASLLQYRVFDGEVQEKDASGLCNVTYHSLGPRSIGKRKSLCEQSSFPKRNQHPSRIFGVDLESSRSSRYELTQNLLPSSIHDQERHKMGLKMQPEVGTVVSSERMLELVAGSLSTKTVEAKTLEHAVALLEPGYRKTSIELQIESVDCPENGCPTLEQAVEEYRSALETKALGTGKSASAFLKLLPLVKSAKPDELLKVIKSPRYRSVKAQLLDIYGSASSLQAHQAAMKVLRQDDVGDDTERYLLALSLSTTPNADVAKDILKRSEETMQNDKVSETVALTAAAMARHHGSPALVEKARVSLELGLESCSGEECKIKFLRALRNLRSQAAVPSLLTHASNDDKGISLTAWRALAALPKAIRVANPEIKKAARRTFYQIGGPKRDSSSRAVALNVILESDPSKEDLEDLVKFLARRESAYEMRKYLSQRMEQLSEKDPIFAEKLEEAFSNAGREIRNYNMFAQKGMSTAFSRTFLKSAESNGSLVTIQEVNAGLLKRGVVDVVLAADGEEQTMFSLGLFASGLASFVSSENQDEENQAEDEEGAATAGMELDFLGVGIRPFIFFSGQGELMGHVWSGTASERTPAFQSLAPIHSYKEYVPLASGIAAEIEVQGAVSFDLGGQIQLSLWSRNAHSMVDLKSAVVVQGGTKVRSDFVQSMAEFAMTLEPRLELSTDVDFSGPVSLCMRLSQPQSTVKNQVYKVERIAGSRHRLRKTRRTRYHSAGRSYHLNRKNNEMCSKVFS